MHEARLAPELDGDARLPQTLGVRLTFVAQGVVLGGDDEGRRQRAGRARATGSHPDLTIRARPEPTAS